MGKDDPRPDQHTDRAHPYQDTGTSETHPAPGGVGTGTPKDPAKPSNIPASNPPPKPSSIPNTPNPSR